MSKRCNESLLWPYNLIYAAINMEAAPSSDIDERMNIILNMLDDRARDVIWRRYHNREKCYDIARTYDISKATISNIISRALDTIKYHYDEIASLNLKAIDVTLDTSIRHLIISYRSYNSLRCHFRNLQDVTVRDVMKLYNSKQTYRFSSLTKTNDLMNVIGIGNKSYQEIAEVLKKHGFITGDIDEYRVIQ